MAAARFATSARETLEAAIIQRDELTRLIEALQTLLGASSNGSPTSIRASKAGAPKKRGKKRDQIQLASDAMNIIKYLEKHPGSPATDLAKIADYGQSLKVFVSKYGGGANSRRLEDHATPSGA